MKRVVSLLLACWSLPAAAASTVVIVEGLGGTERYTEEFAEQVDAIATASMTLSPAPTLKLFRSDGVSRDAVIAYFSALADTMGENDRLIVYLIGHGSYDDHEYKFNIAGPDLTDADILAALDAAPTSNQVIVSTGSASGAALEKWRNESRVVITATRSGAERHATRFGVRFAAALANPAADLDKNRIVTAQEAFEFADRGVRDYFEGAGQLATEHAEIAGAQAARVSLARLGAARPTADDARLAELLEFRDAIAARAEDLRLARDDMPDDEYQSELFRVMLELAEAEEAIEQRERELQ